MPYLLIPVACIAAAWWIWSRAHRAPWRGPPPDVAAEGFDRLHRYALHLRRRLRNEARDPSLPAGHRERAARGFADLDSLLGAHPLTDDLRRWILLIERDPILSHPSPPS